MQFDGENMWQGELRIDNPPPASGIIGTVVSYVPVVVHATPGPLTFEVVGGVPLGLSLNTSTGVLNGTLSINLGGAIKMKVTDSIGRTYTTP